jgi:phosphoglycerate dehydrogenase-like enzyme
MAMPLTPETEGVIGREELRALSPSAYLLNPARGPIVQENALIEALKEKFIAGAALDTHYVYPMPPDHPLWQMENVIMTPHISGSTGSPYFLERLWDLFLQNVERYLTGSPMLNRLPVKDLG